MPFDPCLKHGCFKIVGGWGLVARRSCNRMPASEFGRKGGWAMEYMWRWGESSGLCMQFEFARHGIFDQGSSFFFSCVACE
jgi:hypothetical protein